ncbi:DUF6383 domain-containing protein [Parabacteroides sp. PF5-9]|uniref:DUF6383 domain-containing protein n=1 Tax=Parabacteroides sp. PF5-9 TaxID=1742404 RepID=UPI0024755B72|nr:DUF6383 domain-containing protein [Parabacteroides sp. PF5-9]MDH6358225.1 hypothetical protein [Parabacteroides sp. PF5-9]
MKKMVSTLLASIMMMTGLPGYAETTTGNESGSIERTVKFFSANSPAKILCDGQTGELSVKYIQGETKPQYLIMSEKQTEVGFVTARFLVNDKETTHLSFIRGRLYGDSLVVLNTSAGEKEIHLNAFDENSYNPVLFSFRLVDEDPEGDFLIESWSAGNQTGEWIKIQEGRPVIAQTSLDAALKNEAEIFNLSLLSGKMLTSNSMNDKRSEISVKADYGTITIHGASGKKVQITNASGQTVANEWLNSDYKTMSVPAGITLVAVEGQPTMKVVVK